MNSTIHKILMTRQRRKVCGIDIQKLFLVATILDNCGICETRKYRHDLDDLLPLKDWIVSSHDVSVSFESTIDYLHPLFLVLHPDVPISLDNAYLIKMFTVRKLTPWIRNGSLNLS